LFLAELKNNNNQKLVGHDTVTATRAFTHCAGHSNSSHPLCGSQQQHQPSSQSVTKTKPHEPTCAQVATPHMCERSNRTSSTLALLQSSAMKYNKCKTSTDALHSPSHANLELDLVQLKDLDSPTHDVGVSDEAKEELVHHVVPGICRVRMGKFQ
jgi:hypothetical protein